MIIVAIAVVDKKPQIVYWTRDYKVMDQWLQSNTEFYDVKVVQVKEPKGDE
jgi:hypothetical protein